MKSLEQILEDIQYLTEEDVTNPKWKLEDFVKISSTLTEDDYLTYIIYQQFRPDLSEDEKDTVNKIIKIKQALEKREIQKRYAHFKEVK